MSEEYKMTELGYIPYDWQICSVKDFTASHKQGYYTKDSYSTEGIKLVRITDLKNPKIDFSEMPHLKISDKDYDYFAIEEGDFLFARSGAIGRYGIVEYVQHPAVFASYLIKFRFDITKIQNRFFGYFYESELCSTQLKKISQGNANININAENIKSLKVPVPPLIEQDKIAEILSTVDEKIEVIEQQIKQTTELKKGLMQRLLTKGIGHTQFKDSPLGEIPESWDVVNSSEVFELIHGYQFRDYDFTPSGLKILKIGQMKANGKIDLQDCSFIALERSKEFRENVIKNGDVLMALTGATLGKSCLVSGLNEPVYQNYRVGRFEPLNKNMLNKDYLYFLISSPIVLDQVFAKVNSGAQGNVGKSDFVKLKIPLPKIEEQIKIASILKTVDEKQELLGEKIGQFHGLKKGLMQQLLTGKLRVNHLIKIEEYA